MIPEYKYSIFTSATTNEVSMLKYDHTEKFLVFVLPRPDSAIIQVQANQNF